MLYPNLNELSQSKKTTSVFYGYNHNLKIKDGEFWHTENLTTDYYPVLSSRDKRGIVKTLENPRGIAGGTAIAYIDGSSIFYNNTDITSYLTAKNISISPLTNKQLVIMGAYLCIFPDKLYINTKDFTDCGLMENIVSIDASTNNITLSICDIDGASIDIQYSQSTEPAAPDNGDYWIDTSGETHILRRYSGTQGAWSTISSVYVKIAALNIGKGFSKYDGVSISGLSAGAAATLEQTAGFNTSCIIYACDTNYIVIAGLIDNTVVQTTGTVVIKRSLPELDFVIECQNRLWGCKYGTDQNGIAINEIYCCKLGDFKNWNSFLGISTDSYAASVGTDGEWTGAIAYQGYPLFFKENYIHKVYISSSGAHKINVSEIQGVSSGCFASLQNINGTLFYKSVHGIAAYDGSSYNDISYAFGDLKYRDAVAGSSGDKYYISMKDDCNSWHLFVYDVRAGLWIREDNSHIFGFAASGEELFFIDADSKELIAAKGSAGAAEEAFNWEAVSGIFGYEYPDKKYISRFDFRIEIAWNAYMQLFIQYDSDGIWRESGTIQGRGTKRTIVFPVRPRRCDHLQIKIAGLGEIKIFNVAKIIECGSDI